MPVKVLWIRRMRVLRRLLKKYREQKKVRPTPVAAWRQAGGEAAGDGTDGGEGRQQQRMAGADGGGQRAAGCGAAAAAQPQLPPQRYPDWKNGRARRLRIEALVLFLRPFSHPSLTSAPPPATFARADRPASVPHALPQGEG